MEYGQEELAVLLDWYKEKKNLDFSDYSSYSFNRRLLKALNNSKIKSIKELTEKLKADLRLSDRVLKDMIVPKTEMFRDPGFWKLLVHHLIPDKLKHKKELNILLVGTSSGEELYSLIILLHEYAFIKKCKITATELADVYLSHLKNGTYLLRNQLNNHQNYHKAGGKLDLSNYYAVNNYFANYNPELINDVEFKSCHLTQSVPDGKYDLIICRDQLIYLNEKGHHRAVLNLYEVAEANAYLCIGAKERIWDAGWKLYNNDESVFVKN